MWDDGVAESIPGRVHEILLGVVQAKLAGGVPQMGFLRFKGSWFPEEKQKGKC